MKFWSLLVMQENSAVEKYNSTTVLGCKNYFLGFVQEDDMLIPVEWSEIGEVTENMRIIGKSEKYTCFIKRMDVYDLDS